MKGRLGMRAEAMLKIPLTLREILRFHRLWLGGKYLVTNGAAKRPLSHRAAAQLG